MRLWQLLIPLLLVSACSPTDRQAVDRLNKQSYAYHYRNLDSTAYYARQAYQLAEGYDAGRAEALNNLAFVNIIRMDYAAAERQLDSVFRLTDNQVELLVANVQQMRLCQRRSRNREFHEYRERANRCMARLREERTLEQQQASWGQRYGETEYAIVNSTYYYYVGLERQSIRALRQIDPTEVERDTAQWLNYLYNIGAGGIITEGSQQSINQQEFDHLLRCLMLARHGDYPYFAANALEALSEHLQNPAYRQQLIADNLPAMKFLNPIGVDDDMLAGYLAENALSIFLQYGDVYQVAGAYRTLASCYRQIDDYESCLFNLEQALSDSAIYQAPDLVASIREQLSVAYSAIDDKPNSDLNRNLYLDLMADTRQDRQLEARASQYDRQATQLNWMLGAVVVAIVLLIIVLWLLAHLKRRKTRPTELDDLLEERHDQLAMARRQLQQSERRHLEQRAKLSLVNSITPLIDRILYEIDNLHGGSDAGTEAAVARRLDYVRELTDKINADNDLLTAWIQLRQGEVGLHIESFPLQQLFDLVAMGRHAFLAKGVDFRIEATDTVVKADRTLTLFMLNTLCDNARKFTPRGGSVTLSAVQLTDGVEISVADTGQGMTPQQLDHLFDNKPIHDEQGHAIGAGSQQSHGFGLLNCRGIIEKYRKLSSLFSVCRIGAESEAGRGTRLWFRLPKGMVRTLFCLLVSSLLLTVAAPAEALAARKLTALDRAVRFADSTYYSNIGGTYSRTLQFADSCRYYLNEHYRQQQPRGRYLLLRMGNLSLVPPEIKWFHDSLDTDYHAILDMRNESAVAALALHQWQLYTYNNKIYTQLFKEMSADNTLGDYCRMMQQSQSNKTIAIILLVLLLASILPAYYLLYYRHRLFERFSAENRQQADLELMGDELRRLELEQSRLHVANAVLDNCLSSLKHETMYYPSRIRQLVDRSDTSSLPEVVGYYRALYGLLSQQAMDQLGEIRLTPRVVDLHGREVLGSDNLLHLLFELLPGTVDSTLTADGAYVSYTIALSREPSRFDWLLCRQIARDHGEATHRRRCGISRDSTPDGQPLARILLPAATGHAAAAGATSEPNPEPPVNNEYGTV
ncbi:MAG: DUF5112 domain-containing protein [Prevotella sp.]|nr:DUF5112 domain-containing protein [Prevotella sp.]